MIRPPAFRLIVARCLHIVEVPSTKRFGLCWTGGSAICLSW